MLDMLEVKLIAYSCMKTSRKETSDNLARAPVGLLSALKDLANLRDDESAFEWFASHWPGFACVGDDNPAENFMGFVYGARWTEMPPSIPKKFFLTWQMREALRRIWGADSDKLYDVLLPTPEEATMDPDPNWVWNPQLKLDWRRGEFVYIPRSEFQEAVYKLFRRSPLAKVCANPDCPAPYFVAGRTTQQYCSEKCSGVLQRKHKLRWWKEHGHDWRRKKSRGKRGKG